jgi:hypothetical protein
MRENFAKFEATELPTARKEADNSRFAKARGACLYDFLV